MPEHGAAARRYAQAVLDMAKKAGTLDQWKTELDMLNEMFGNEQTVSALEDPKLTHASEAKIIDSVFAAEKVSPVAMNFLRLLAERRRLSLLPRIVEVFQELYHKEKGILVAYVTTAIPLDEAHKKRVTDQITRTTGKTVVLQTRTDPSILGGIITQIGDELVDASVATRLSELAEKLT
ncbi:MAG TPA: F0F1 ATP synthase subunit delta [Chloroflexia bacterium]|nr:F0F1 ATP synthase subunit delta [Chloroflexia bacterium]